MSAVVLGLAISAASSCPFAPHEIPFLIINMASHTQRIGRFVTGLPEVWRNQSNVCRIEGVNGSAIPDSSQLPSSIITDDMWKEATARTGFTDGKDLTKGAVGLTLAHARAWRHVVERDFPIAMIAEDDVRFYVPDFAEQLASACEAMMADAPERGAASERAAHDAVAAASSDAVVNATLPLQWAKNVDDAKRGMPEIIQLQSCHTGWEKPGEDWRHLWRTDMTVEEYMKTRSEEPTQLRPGVAFCMALYLLTQQGARRALQSAFPMQVQLDTPGEGPLAQLRYPAVVTAPIAQCDERGIGSDVQVWPSWLPFGHPMTDGSVRDDAAAGPWPASCATSTPYVDDEAFVTDLDAYLRATGLDAMPDGSAKGMAELQHRLERYEQQHPAPRATTARVGKKQKRSWLSSVLQSPFFGQ